MDLSQFFEYSFERPKITRVEDIFNKLRGWDYVPTPKCIQLTFGCSYNTASEVFKSVIQEEATRTKGWRNNPRIFEHIRERVCRTRSVFKKHLLRHHAEQVFKEIALRLPPVRRREF